MPGYAIELAGPGMQKLQERFGARKLWLLRGGGFSDAAQSIQAERTHSKFWVPLFRRGHIQGLS